MKSYYKAAASVVALLILYIVLALGALGGIGLFVAAVLNLIFLWRGAYVSVGDALRFFDRKFGGRSL